MSLLCPTHVAATQQRAADPPGENSLPFTIPLFPPSRHG